MKTIIIRTTDVDNITKLNNVISNLEKYTDKQIKDAVVCTRYLAPDNYNAVCGELKDATILNDYDLFIIGVTHTCMDISTLQTINKAHTLSITDDEYDSAKNFVIMI